MSIDIAVQLLARALWLACLVSAPLLLVILLLGLLVNIGQVVTQLQEMTLSFIPKLIGVVLMLTLAGPWMLSKLTGFALNMFSAIASVQ